MDSSKQSEMNESLIKFTTDLKRKDLEIIQLKDQLTEQDLLLSNTKKKYISLNLQAEQYQCENERLNKTNADLLL